MTLIVVSGKLEEALQAQASQQGIAAESVARRILAQALTPGAEGHRYTQPSGLTRTFCCVRTPRPGQPPITASA